MARIRSIHPAIFTDEAFMEASPHARLMAIGLWCEAWDDGVFEWKPIVLKARLFPADSVDSVAILAELASLNIIKEFAVNGKRYGVVRNFQKFQRPKKPNSSGVMTPEMENYAGKLCGLDDESSELQPSLDEESSPPVPHQFGTGSEILPQMEDGGWRMEDGVSSSLPRTRLDPSTGGGGGQSGQDQPVPDKPEARVIRISKLERGQDDWPDGPALKILVDTINSPWLDPSKSGGLQMPGEIGQWRTNHCSWTEDVLPVVSAMAGKAKKAIGSWSYFTKAIYENRDTRLAKGPPIPQPKAPKHKPQDQAKLAILQDFRDWRGGDLRWPNGGKRPSRNDIFEALQAFGDEDDLAKFQLEFDVIDEAMSA